MTKLHDFQSIGDVLEPFDPNYISDKPYEIPDISKREKRFLRKISILEHKLRRERISFEWLPDDEMFRVHKYRKGTEYPTYMYLTVYMDENKYAFGGYETDLVVDGKVSVVVASVKEWLSNNKPAVR
jgi:hypothetical protein